MSLRHAVLAAVSDGEISGYQLAKTFDVAAASFWHAAPQQLYAELSRMETDGLIHGREVIQDRRPNKRVFVLTETGLAMLQDFVAAPSKPTFVRDDLLVKVRACDIGDAADLIRDLETRATAASGKAELLHRLLLRLRGDQSEASYLAESDRIGIYLTALRGRDFERERATWCRRVSGILRRRMGADDVVAK